MEYLKTFVNTSLTIDCKVISGFDLSFSKRFTTVYTPLSHPSS